MDFKVLIADSAIADLKEIVEFVGDNSDAAIRLGKRLLAHALSLATMPQRFPFPRQAARNSENVAATFSYLLRV